MAAVRIAVIGAGTIGRTHIAVLRSGRPDFTLAAVADPSPSAAEEAQRLGYPVFAGYEEMLDRVRPDGAILAVPNQMHVAVGLACVARSIPILIEKPIADDVASALELVEAAERAGVPTLVGHHRRHNPIMRKAAEIVAGGGIGRLVAANALWLSHKPKPYFDVVWRTEPGGGPVLINAIHDIDCLRMLCGDVETVTAAAGNVIRNFPVEDTAAAVLQFKSGALGTLLVSDTVSAPWSWEWGSRENPDRPTEPESCYLLAGTQGSLTVPTLQHRWHRPGEESWSMPLTQMHVPIRPADAYHEQMRNFSGVIRGTESPVLSGRDATATLATTLAITRSARTGHPVRVEEMLQRPAVLKPATGGDGQ
jgi:predicted dehydrogenase